MIKALALFAFFLFSKMSFAQTNSKITPSMKDMMEWNEVGSPVVVELKEMFYR